MWAYNETFYQIYPIGFCGAPTHNDGICVPRILKLKDWSSYLENLQIGSVLLNPIFESDNHGYDTRDFKKVDCALEPMKIFRMSVTICISIISKSCWTEFSTTLDAVSGHFRMFWRKNGIPRTKTGSTSVLTATQTITTVCGMRLGR